MAASDQQDLLRSRLRLGVASTVTAALAIGCVDAVMQGPARGPFLVLKGGQLALLAVGWWLIRPPASERRLLAVATTVASLLFASTGLAAILRHDLQTTALLLIACNVASASFIPWGTRAQVIVALASGAGVLAAMIGLGRPLAAHVYGIVGIACALVGSIVLAHQNARERRIRDQGAALVAGHTRILEMIATGTPLADVLDALCRMIERQSPGLLCSVLLREGDLLRTGAAPSLPAAYTAAVDGLAIAPENGSCGSAAWHRAPIVVSDVRTDARWAAYRTIAATHGLRACWSVPILLADGSCHGTFAMYYREPRTPDRRAWQLLDSAARLASIALERGRAEVALERSRRELVEESQVSRALVRVGEEMISTIDAPLVLERLCRFATELLDCDTASMSLWESEDDVFRVTSTWGHTPELAADLRAFAMPARLLAPLMAALETTPVVEIRASRLDSEQARRIYQWLGVERSLYVPLRRGQTTLGFLCAARAADRAFSPVESRIASGLVHLAALALENARLVDELRTATRLKSEFVSTMSHELRTPLSVIIGYTEMLHDANVSGPERGVLLGRVRRQSLELLELIEATLDLGRLEAGRDRPHPEPVDVAALFAELETDFTTMRRVPGPELVWEAGVGQSLVTDPRKLRTVLKNLVGNALKFTPSGSIVVTGRDAGASAVFTVRDTGIGIPDAQLPVIWDMFRQVDGSDARSYAGVGLGLYIVRRLVGQLGGTVTVTSTVGQGTTFTVTLPHDVPALRAAG